MMWMDPDPDYVVIEQVDGDGSVQPSAVRQVMRTPLGVVSFREALVSIWAGFRAWVKSKLLVIREKSAGSCIGRSFWSQWFDMIESQVAE